MEPNVLANSNSWGDLGVCGGSTNSPKRKIAVTKGPNRERKCREPRTGLRYTEPAILLPYLPLAMMLLDRSHLSSSACQGCGVRTEPPDELHSAVRGEAYVFEPVLSAAIFLGSAWLPGEAGVGSPRMVGGPVLSVRSPGGGFSPPLSTEPTDPL